MTRRRLLSILTLTSAVLAAAGCSYYEITDPATGKSYYTNNWDLKEYKKSSVTRFKTSDGKVVALDEYERKKISKDDFVSATGEDD